LVLLIYKNMDSLLLFITEHAQYAHFAIFGLFILAGLNFPISEDLLIIVSGVLASTIVPQNLWKLFIAVFLGAYISDWIPYWIGRLLGVRLWKRRFFSRMVKPERLKQIQSYYARYGVLTLIVGRFIPFGVRNCLFAAAGMANLSFTKFLICDGLACLCSNATLFTISYLCGKNHQLLWTHLKWANIIIFTLFLIAIIAFFWYKRIKVRSVDKTTDLDR